MNWEIFTSTFALIFLAEFPDKTAIAILIMASRNNAVAVFIGTALAFLIQSLVAIAFGSVLALLPERTVHIGSALLFFIFAALMLKPIKPEEENQDSTVKGPGKPFWKAVGSSFLVIFVAEWGDLTQILTATLEAKYRAPWTIFTAATLALWSVSALATVAGHHLQQRISQALLHKVAAACFFAAGIYLLFN